MIILLGPDGSGKTTLAKELEACGLLYYHFTKDSNYTDYLRPLTKLEMIDAVLDRHIICEYPYSTCKNRPFKFTLKQWHNILLLTFIQSPIIVLCTHKPNRLGYPKDQYLPYDKWDLCLTLYKEFLASNGIAHLTYDYASGGRAALIDRLLKLNSVVNESTLWWRAQWEAGYGCIGYSHPKFLLVAERIGPNNVNSLPFETGPTGYMLSNMIYHTKTPLGSLAVTNMVKSFRKDTRKPNDRDVELLREEIANLKPRKVIFMGTPARQGIPLAKEMGCEVDTIVHLGSLNYKGVKDMTGYYSEWRAIIGMKTKVIFK